MGVTIRRNSKPVKANPFYHFDKESGYFGIHKPSNKETTRTIYTKGDPEEEARKLFEQFTSGGKIEVLVEGHMWGCSLDDGTYVTLRINHPLGHAPAVELSVRQSKDPAGIVGQKIHFEKEHK